MAFHSRGRGSGSGPASSSSSGFHFLNSSFGDTTYTKVFVGSLSWETNSESLRHHFEQFGHILEAVVIADKSTGRSKGYGFVTFKEPESAQRACEDPTPVIDGRRANCNLASLRRLQPAISFAQPRLASPYVGGVPIPQGAYMGNSTQQQPAPFSYQQGFQYPTFSYTPYGPEYVYPQNVYNPYMGQLYYQVYGVPGAVNTAVFPPGQFGQPIPNAHGYVAVQGYTTPGHHILQIGGPSVNGVTSSTQPSIQTPYPTGLVAPITTQAHLIVSAPSPHTQENGSEQAAS